MTSLRLARCTALLALVIGCVSPAVAALDIYVLDSRFETFVSASSPDPYSSHYDDYDEAYSYTQLQRSADPQSDSVYAASYPPYVAAAASAAANPFDVVASTRTWVDSRASAHAKTELTFSALSDEMQEIGLTFSRSNPRYFSQGYASLVDVTTNEEYWRYGWSGLFEEQDFFGDTFSPLVKSVDTDFFKDHIYRLSIFSGVATSEEQKWMSIGVSGLQIAAAVPEPETWAMFMVGVAFLGAIALRRRDGSGAGHR